MARNSAGKTLVWASLIACSAAMIGCQDAAAPRSHTAGSAAAATQPAARTATGPSTRPPLLSAIRIGHDTTRIKRPLKPDGTVDYFGAIREKYTCGVTNENNAAVLLAEVLGPDAFWTSQEDVETVKRQTLQELGLQFKDGQKFLDLSAIDREVLIQAIASPWAAAEHSDLARWLQENSDLLALATKATQRPYYWWPLVIDNAKPRLLVFALSLSPFSKYQKLANVLRARANLAIHEDRIDDAWGDVLAIYRLSKLIGQDPWLIGKLVAIAMSRSADGAAQEIARSDKMTARLALQMMGELAALGNAPTVMDALDVGERFIGLDFTVHVATSPPEQWAQIVDLADEAGQFKTMDPARLAPKIDPNIVLKELNRHYDGMVAICREKNLARRERLKDQFVQAREKTARASRNIPADSATPTEVTQWAADLFVSVIGSDLTKSQVLSDRVQAGRQLTLLSLALAGYHADNGEYPARLADLSPRYIKAVPTDFFAGGKEFAYKVTKGGYVLYSVGDNGKDDGGNDAASGVAGADDIVVRVGAAESADSRPVSRP